MVYKLAVDKLWRHAVFIGKRGERPRVVVANKNAPIVVRVRGNTAITE